MNQLGKDDIALEHAKRLAIALWERWYRTDAPNWKVQDDLLGVILQIDNMTTGLERR